MLQMTFVHDHECSRARQRFELRPEIRDGVAFVTNPVCVETHTELRLVSTIHWPQEQSPYTTSIQEC